MKRRAKTINGKKRWKKFTDRLSQYLGVRKVFFEKNNAGTWRAVLAVFRGSVPLKVLPGSQYFEVLYYCRYFRTRSLSGFVTVDTPCT